MSYIPSNPHFAVVNCKIGDLNLTPIPPNTLESFTYERNTDSGMGNKFSIVVHDETAIVMESYLAETAFKGMNSESYDFGDELVNIYKEGNDSTDINVKPSPESSSDSTTTENDSGSTVQTMSIDSLTPIGSVDDLPRFYQSVSSDSLDSNDEELTLKQDNSNHAAIRARRIRENDTALSSASNDTNMISGGVGKSTTTNTSPIYSESSYHNAVIPLKIDDSKLVYADPSTGIRELGGFPIGNDVWMSEKAIAEFSDGSDPNDPEL